MKTIKILVFCVAPFFLSCCNEAKIYMKYHFFTRGEVESVYINTDSVIHFQEEVAKYETYDVFKQKQRIYFESDTVEFLSETGDTIKFQSQRGVQIQEKLDAFMILPETYSHIGTILLIINNDSFFSYIGYHMIKEKINDKDSLTNSIEVKTIEQSYSFSNPFITSGTNYYVTKEAYNSNNIKIDNCYFIHFVENNNIKLQIVYSNKYGFLQLKSAQHEINQIL